MVQPTRTRASMSRPKPATKDLHYMYDQIKELSGGALNGGVYIVRHKKSGELMVLKTIQGDDIHKGSAILEEINNLRILDHPNIVQYHHSYIQLPPLPKKAGILLECCDKGGLDSLIRRLTIRARKEQQANERAGRRLITTFVMPEDFIRHTLVSLANALSYIHHGVLPHSREPDPLWQTILHRDIKPANVLIKTRSIPNEHPRILLADFGLSIRRGHKDWNSTRGGGTVGWHPKPFEHSTRSDVWAVGAIISSMCLLDEGPVFGEIPEDMKRKSRSAAKSDQDEFQRWCFDPDVRKGAEHRGVGIYSAALEKVVRGTLRHDIDQRTTTINLLKGVDDLTANDPVPKELMVDTAWRD